MTGSEEPMVWLYAALLLAVGVVLHLVTRRRSRRGAERDSRV